MTSDPNSWKEVKAKRAHDGRIWEYQRGYRVQQAGRHEDEKGFRAFQFYLNSGAARSLAGTAEACGNSAGTVAKWYDTYNWGKRCAAYDKQQMAILKKGSSMMIPSKLLNARSSNHLISVNGDSGEQGEESQRAKLMADLDDMYNKISVEQAVV